MHFCGDEMMVLTMVIDQCKLMYDYAKCFVQTTWARLTIKKHECEVCE